MTAPWPADRAERRALASLKPFDRNARTHTPEQVTQIAASIEQWGWTMPVLIDDDGGIIAGHARVMAALQLGLVEVPVIVATGWSDEQKRAYVIADNKLALNAGWDEELLAQELAALREKGFDLDLIGFGDDELQALLGQNQTAITGNTDPDAVPDKPAVPTTRRGDLWLMGSHRLICGDCRESADMVLLMGGDEVNLAFTSPPYAQQRDYDEASGFEPIPPDAYVDWFEAVAANVADALADDGSWFVNIKPAAEGLDTLLYVHDLVAAHVRHWGWHWVTELCWERPGVPKMVRRRFKNQFEPVYQFARGEFKMRADVMRTPSQSVPKPRGKGAGNTSWGRHQGGGIQSIHAAGKQGTPGFAWFGDHVGPGLAYPGNLLPTFTGTHEATGHSAAFPVGLPEWFMRAYSDVGDVVLDPFAGSGSTMIAAEGTGRRGRAVEISPVYCDVTVMRWQDFTGKTAILDGDGRSFAEVREQRSTEPPPVGADPRPQSVAAPSA